MALRFTFGTTPGGTLRPASDLDQVLTDVGLLGIIPAAAAGTNAIVLTPAVNTPVVAAYATGMSFGFIAVANSTGAVTLGVNALAQKNVYLQDGVTQAGSGSITNGTFYIASYVASYNSGAGGWSLTGNQPAASPDFSALTTTALPNTSAFVAGSIGGGPSNNRKFGLDSVGGYSHLTEQTAASSATVDFVLTSYIAAGIEDFEFIHTGIQPGTNAVDYWARFSTDGGTTYDSGAGNYGWLAQGSTPSAAVGTGSNSDTHIQLNAAPNLGTGANQFFSARMFLPAVASVRATQTEWHGFYLSNTPNSVWCSGGGYRAAAQDTDAVRFMMSSGNIAVGKIVLMGRRT